MKLRLALVLLLSFTSLTIASAGSVPKGWSKANFSNSVGARDYYIYVPQSYNGQSALPLMVMLHGCFQDAATFAKETGMNNIADKYGFAVIYPEQTYQNNIWKCWNWFKPENQRHNSGELSIVAGMVQQMQSKANINAKKIYVAGLSAGGAMAANLAACYNDLFSGAGIHSGLEYSAATTESEAHQVTQGGSTHDINLSGIQAAQCSGPQAKMTAIVSIHGDSDPYVNPINATNVIAQFTQMNDILDNKLDDNSQNSKIITTHEDQVPNGYRYKAEFYGGNDKVLQQKVTVLGMKHAWSGAHQMGQYADPKGPDASELIWLFLSSYSIK